MRGSIFDLAASDFFGKTFRVSLKEPLMRLFACIANLAAIAFLIWALWVMPGQNAMSSLFIGSFMSLAVLNTYLLTRPVEAGRKGRLSRMMGYWMDAKEAELKDRADGGRKSS